MPPGSHINSVSSTEINGSYGGPRSETKPHVSRAISGSSGACRPLLRGLIVLAAGLSGCQGWLVGGGRTGTMLALGRGRNVRALRGSSRALELLGLSRPARLTVDYTPPPVQSGCFLAAPNLRSSGQKTSLLSMAASTKTPAAKKVASKPRAASTKTSKPSPAGESSAVKSAGRRSSAKKVLVIVESPAKAKTISQLLKKASGGGFEGYTVDACNGHVRDLVGKKKDIPPELKAKTKKWEIVGVDVENGFEPMYIPNLSKKAIVNRLKKAAAKADEIILATDEDREGEAISWHLLQVLEPKVPVRRAVFHEITQEAILKAFEGPGEIDTNLVQAQEARRILDRLAGFTLTPVVWKLVAPGLSAGRVQSVALAMVVERERARLSFKSADYWDVVANVTAAGEPGRPFEARLVQVGAKTLVTGKDFDPDTGELKAKLDASTLELLGSEGASAVAASVSSLEVLSVEKRRVRRKPPAPFITSTLQQEASRKLRLGVTQTMRAAQALYEAGHITYMRTDRPSLSKAAAGVAEQAVRDSFGEDFVRKGEAKVVKVKGSQEAHEAIRPALLTASTPGNAARGETHSDEGNAAVEAGAGQFIHPSDLPLEGLEPQHRALYDLIYRRTLASSMAESEADFTTVSLGAGGIQLSEEGDEVTDVVFKASGKTTVFEGYLKAYEESADEKVASNDEGNQETELPLMAEGDEILCEETKPAPHRTSPPRRFSEATFIKELEAQGVGRPSTYATILEKLRTRAYVNMQGRALTPSLTGFVVADLLREHFPDFTDTTFTAQMENQLDEIASGRKGRVEYLSEYYLGEQGLRATVAGKKEAIDPLEAKRARLPGLEGLDDRCAIFVGPYGGYLVREGADMTSSDTVDVAGREENAGTRDGGGKGTAGITLPYVAQDNLELLTVELVERCLDLTYKGGDILGQHPDTGEDILIRMGRYGPYLQCGERSTAAIAHASTANKKNPNDLSLPSQLPSIDQLRRPSESGSTTDVSASDGKANGNNGQRNETALAADEDAAKASAVLTAEDVMAFGFGLDGSASNDTLAAEISPSSSLVEGGGGQGSASGAWYSAVSLERAVGLLSLPRVVCESHPEHGGEVEVGVSRFGVFVKHNELYSMVPNGVDVLDVDKAMALDLVDATIQRNIDRPTIELGVHNGHKVLVKYGRWGRFIYCNGARAQLPAKYKKVGETEPDEISLEEAIELLEAKRAKDPAAASRGGRVSASKSNDKSSGSGKKKQASGSPRPLTGFMRFCQDCRLSHAAAGDAQTGSSGAPTRLTASDLSVKWKALSEEQRAGYNAASAADRAEWKAKEARETWAAGNGGGDTPAGFDLTGYDMYCEDNSFKTPSEYESLKDGWGSLTVDEQKELDERARSRRSKQGKQKGHERASPPKSAYLLFTGERRPQLKEEHGYPPTVMMSKLAEEWREMEANGGREVYVRRAARLKEEWHSAREGAGEGLEKKASGSSDRSPARPTARRKGKSRTAAAAGV